MDIAVKNEGLILAGFQAHVLKNGQEKPVIFLYITPGVMIYRTV